MNKIEIKNLYLIFGSEKQKALRMLKEGKSKNEILKTTDCTIAVKDANLDIHEGEFFVIMGLSGSGKSTLLRCINRLIKPTKGQILINGKNITTMSDKELLDMRRHYGVSKLWLASSSQCVEQHSLRIGVARCFQTGT